MQIDNTLYIMRLMVKRAVPIFEDEKPPLFRMAQDSSLSVQQDNATVRQREILSLVGAKNM